MDAEIPEVSTDDCGAPLGGPPAPVERRVAPARPFLAEPRAEPAAKVGRGSACFAGLAMVPHRSRGSSLLALLLSLSSAASASVVAVSMGPSGPYTWYAGQSVCRNCLSASAGSTPSSRRRARR